MSAIEKLNFLECCPPVIIALGTDYQTYSFTQRVRGWNVEFTAEGGWQVKPGWDSDLELGIHLWLKEEGTGGFNNEYNFVAGEEPIRTENPDLNPEPNPQYVNISNPLSGSTIFPAIESYLIGIDSADFTPSNGAGSSYSWRAVPTSHTLDFRMSYTLAEFRFTLPEDTNGEWLSVVYRSDFIPSDGSEVVEGEEITVEYDFSGSEEMLGDWVRLPNADWEGRYILTPIKYKYYHSSPWIMVE